VVVRWVSSVEWAVVVVFPVVDDPMVRGILVATPHDSHPDYTRETFEMLLRGAFRIADSRELQSGTRTLYRALPA
jgi:hypothetical protein